MSKNKNKAVLKVLETIRKTGSGSVTYFFEDNTILTQPVNSKIFKTDKGTYTPLTEIIRIFNTTMHDLHATNFKVNY